MYLVKTPRVVQNLFDGLHWKINTNEPKVYITFDDGPIPELTPWVLDTLDQYNAKATFFCVGENVIKNPILYKEVIKRGHSVGNHTYNHLNSWKTDHYSYIKNVMKCKQVIDSRLFRPPYGKLKPLQSNFLRKRFRVIMWDVLSGDFDQDITPEQCLENVVNNLDIGSIIVFHDNLKAEKNLKYALPKTLEYIYRNGMTCEALNPKIITNPRSQLI
jgi:peptidoglycan-N-acetylglucosamine deacetylase